MHKFVHIMNSPPPAPVRRLVLEIQSPSCGLLPLVPGLIRVTSLLAAADVLVEHAMELTHVICDDEVEGPIDAWTFLERVRELHPWIATQLRMSPAAPHRIDRVDTADVRRA